MSLFFCGISFAQNSISGTVTNSKNEPISGANVKVAGESSSTSTDFDGTFTVKSSKATATIEVSNLGYETKKAQATAGTKVTIMLQDLETKLNEIVVSASRTPERVLESPVTIERMGIAEIKKSASPSFYDGLENMKEVQMNSSSLSFKSINTRGFATVANTRFMQLVDGMDNSSPLLNFVLGNLVGISEIDVQSVELLPGASSALYGANAFNGILFMTSKSPFKSEGITTYLKYGQTSQDAAGTNAYYDFGVRAAHAFSRHFAAKANVTFMKGTDWFATNYNDISVAGRTREHFGYNGVNVYGDEAELNLKSRQAFGSAGYNILPNETISRTGYNETDLTDNRVANTKADFSLHFRPFGNENLEVIWQSKFGFGNSVYQGASRYYLNNFFMQQHKLEFKGKNFFLRGYTTSEDGGRSYDMTFTALNINRSWKSDQQWFTQYGSAFSAASLGFVPGIPNANNPISDTQEFHNYARSVADTGRLIPGTPAFKQAFNKVIADPNVLTGSKLVDNSRIWHSDANYNLKDIIKPVEIQVGGSYRLYELNSFGRIYTDANSTINYNEYGVYTQLQKKLLNDKLKLTGSVRYDKAQNFVGNFSPRISLVYSAGNNKNHTFRSSFQTGFRNPSTQDQYIGFDIGSRVLIGSAADNLSRFSELRGDNINGSGTISSAGQTILGATTARLTGNEAYFNSFTKESFTAFDAAYRSGPPSGLANAAALLVKSNAKLVKPETVKAMELGYRGVIKGFALDLNGYYNIYNNFIGNLNVITPYYGTAETKPSVTINNAPLALAGRDFREYQLYTNTDVEIKSLGFGAGLTRKVYGNFELSANYNFAEFDFNQTTDSNFEASFNTPKHRAKATLSNDKLFGKLGASLSGRWNSEYRWESSFADGIIEEATVIDAQINYIISSWKTTVKVGATNLGGKEYGQVLGAGLIGQQWFESITINP